MVHIKGVKKTSLIDYPKNICTTIFLGNCNFKCKFCHNPGLVFNKFEDVIAENELIDFLNSRKKNVEAVCVTGGEPLINEGVFEFLKKIKNEGFKVKLDTNGSMPKLLKKIIEEKVVDFIAMDIKTSLEKYNDATGVKIDCNAILESIELIKNSNIDYEFRTTVVPGIVEKEDIFKIAKMLGDVKRYTLQQFRNDIDMINSDFKNVKPYSYKELEEFKYSIKELIQNVVIVRN